MDESTVDPESASKRCSICQRTLPLENFTRDRRAADGRDGRCRACKSGKYAAWQQAQDQTALREKWRGYYYDNVEQRTAASRARYWADPESAKAYQRERTAADPESARAVWRESFRRRAPEMRPVRRARQRAVRLADPERHNALRRAAYARNPEPAREQVRRRNAAKRAGVRLYGVSMAQIAAKVAYWGGRCWMCREAPYEALDHVKPLAAGGAHMIANLRPACHACNRRKSDTWPYPTARASQPPVRP